MDSASDKADDSASSFLSWVPVGPSPIAGSGSPELHDERCSVMLCGFVFKTLGLLWFVYVCLQYNRKKKTKNTEREQ